MNNDNKRKSFPDAKFTFKDDEGKTKEQIEEEVKKMIAERDRTLAELRKQREQENTQTEEENSSRHR